jgi:hypothetical protein
MPSDLSLEARRAEAGEKSRRPYTWLDFKRLIEFAHELSSMPASQTRQIASVIESGSVEKREHFFVRQVSRGYMSVEQSELMKTNAGMVLDALSMSGLI